MNDEKEAEIIEKFNLFIKKWTGNSYPHLIDDDENDGEWFREELRSHGKAMFEKGQANPSFEVNRLTTLLAETENARKWWQNKAKELESRLKEADVKAFKLDDNWQKHCNNLEHRLKEAEDKLKRHMEWHESPEENLNLKYRNGRRE